MSRIQKYLNDISDWEAKADGTNKLVFFIIPDDWKQLKPQIEDMYDIEEQQGYHIQVTVTKKPFTY